MFEGHLSHEMILKLQQVAIALGLAGQRNALLAGVAGGFVAGLRVAAAPAAQLMMDLGQMNTTERLVDGSVPLVTWLRNAHMLTSYAPASSVFQEALDRIQNQRDDVPPQEPNNKEDAEPTGLELDNQRLRKFREALLSAYPDTKLLEMMVSDRLGEALKVFVNVNQPLEQVVFDLLQWATAHGKMAPLLVGARASNPDNPKLFRFCQDLGLTSTQEPRSNLERIVSGNNVFLDVAKWRAELTRMEWRVCKIELAGQDTGTGFLVGPDMIMTNHHVVEAVIKGQYQPSQLQCRFDFKMSEEGCTIAMGEVFSLADEWLYDSSPSSFVDRMPDPKPSEPGDHELDYAMLRLRQRAGDMSVGDALHGERRGWVSFPRSPVHLSSHKMLAILQHPQGKALKLAMDLDQNIIINKPGNRIRYTLPTHPGSSGSPVFGSDWQLIALHHSGEPKHKGPTYNEGIPIEKIMAQEKVQAFLAELLDEE